MAELHEPRPVVAMPAAGQSSLARATTGLPFRPYVYAGNGEDIYEDDPDSQPRSVQEHEPS